jgi:predicted component of type VI protein secretion system
LSSASSDYKCGEANHAIFAPDGRSAATANSVSTKNSVSSTCVWDVHLATQPADQLVTQACQHRLGWNSILSREEMRQLGYPDTQAEIDVCEGVR